MFSIEGLLLLLLAGAGAAGLFLLVSALSREGEGAAGAALSRGDFEAALTAAGERTTGIARSELLAAVGAAKHLMRLDDAAALLDGLLAEDPRDHEALLERGLVAAYGSDPELAERFFLRAGSRPDLIEPLTLHRAWCRLDQGRTREALALFEEIEAPLENKLRTDLGTGDPEFAEWFLQAAALWRASGYSDKAAWAARAGEGTVASSRLIARICPPSSHEDTDALGK